MKLLTKELLNRFKKIGCQDGKDPLVICKFFHPCSPATWYATEYYPEEKSFFGYVSLFGDHCDEWGYFSLEELESLRGGKIELINNDTGIKTTIIAPHLGVERDLYFTEKRFSELDLKNG